MNIRYQSLKFQLFVFCVIACSLYLLTSLTFISSSNNTAMPTEVDTEAEPPNLSGSGAIHDFSLTEDTNFHHAILPKELINKKLNFDQVYEPRPVSFVDYRHSPNVNDSEMKIILLWTPWNGLWETINYYHLRPGTESFVSYSCPNRNCYVTKDEKFLQRADAVFFHLLDIERRGRFPSYRNPNQRWLLYIMEAPWQVGMNMNKLRSLFNWTMSFRDDSDIVVKYGFVGKRSTPRPTADDRFQRVESLAEKKSAVWFVSDCKTESKREDYVRELRRYIDVDVYGLCGEKKCFPSQSDVCYQRVLKNYKFYLSFENSICRNYVTEKFFNVLSYDIVPVVFGGANYTKVAPPGSFIDATEFPEPKDLAEFLKKVGGNESLYDSYFDWKTDYSVYLHPWMCYLCDKLHEPVGHSVHEDVHKWWMRDSSCKRWTASRFEDVIR